MGNNGEKMKERIIGIWREEMMEWTPRVSYTKYIGEFPTGSSPLVDAPNIRGAGKCDF